MQTVLQTTGTVGPFGVLSGGPRTDIATGEGFGDVLAEVEGQGHTPDWEAEDAAPRRDEADLLWASVLMPVAETQPTLVLPKVGADGAVDVAEWVPGSLPTAVDGAADLESAADQVEIPIPSTGVAFLPLATAAPIVALAGPVEAAGPSLANTLSPAPLTLAPTEDALAGPDTPQPGAPDADSALVMAAKVVVEGPERSRLPSLAEAVLRSQMVVTTTETDPADLSPISPAAAEEAVPSTPTAPAVAAAPVTANPPMVLPGASVTFRAVTDPLPSSDLQPEVLAIDAEPVALPHPTGPHAAPGPNSPVANTPALAARIVETLIQRSDQATEIALSPEELGRVQLTIQTDAQNPDRVVIQLNFDRADTMDLFRRHADQLAEAIRSAGYAQVDIGFGSHTSGGEAGSRGDPVEPDGITPTAGPQEAEPMHNRPGHAGSGLDLRV